MRCRPTSKFSLVSTRVSGQYARDNRSSGSRSMDCCSAPVRSARLRNPSRLLSLEHARQLARGHGTLTVVDTKSP